MKKLLLASLLVFITVSVGLSQSISYIHSDLTYEEVTAETIDWVTYTEPIYEGFHNGVYWFKVAILPSDTPQILSIPESHITRTQFYHQGNRLEGLSYSRYPAFKISPSDTKKTYYLKVNCLLEGRIPIEISSDDQYHDSEYSMYLIIGLYIGIILPILLFNLLSYYSLRNPTYIHYVFMVIGLAMNALYKDGVFALIFGLEGVNERLEPVVNLIVVISSIFFTTSYLQLDQQFLKTRKYGVAMVVAAVISMGIYQLIGNFFVFAVIHIFNLLALDIFWSCSVLLWNKSHYSKFFAIAYGLPLFFAHDYYISPHFGIMALNLPLNYYKLGSVFEMVIFTYAIMYQTKQLNKENELNRKKLLEYAKRLEKGNKGLNQREATTMELIEAYGFTLKEIQVLKVVAQDKTNQEIADELFISQNTVKFHIRNILSKLQVSNRRDAGRKYLNFHEELEE